MKLLSVSKDVKTKKGEKYGFLTGILYLAPSDSSGVINTCPWASKGCRASCLFTAGRGAFDSVKNARIAKTLRFHNDREGFLLELCADISRLIAKAKKLGLTPVVRLNGTSDLDWHTMPVAGKPSIMHVFPEIQFYDYTKNARKAIAHAQGLLPANYHVTFSRAESNGKAVEQVAQAGGNIAVVFENENFPETYLGKPVVSGDTSDLRFLDGRNVIVGLKSKGQAKRDTSGFVVHTN